MVYPKVSGLAAWTENWKWYSCLPGGAVVSPFCESIYQILLLNECLFLLLFISLSTQSGNFWIHTRMLTFLSKETRQQSPQMTDSALCMTANWNAFLYLSTARDLNHKKLTDIVKWNICLGRAGTFVRHENLAESGGIAPRIHNLITRRRRVLSASRLGRLTPLKILRCPLGRRLAEPHGLYGRGAEEKVSLPLPEVEPRLPSP
jgi:hypothetical protein